MQILILGSGGREHALARVLARSPSVRRIGALPGNDAMAAAGVRCFSGRPENPDDVLRAVREFRADLVAVGPEAPLAAGIADAVRKEGPVVLGPGKEGARLEASKAWAKRFMQRWDIPTAEAWTFRDFTEAESHIRSCAVPPVVKVDGLAGGKGVTVADTHEEAIAAARRALVEGAFGPSGRTVVLEERLAGSELSVLAILDGQTWFLLPAAQDYKAVWDGGRGPNTGGMGAHSPVPGVDDALLREVEERVIRPAVKGLTAEGIDYRGVLYAGLMLTASGPKVLEFNCRFGDPETQAVLPRLAGDPARLLLSAAEGKLQPELVQIRDEAAVCVILASEGYPGAYMTDRRIEGLNAEGGLQEPQEDVMVDHAGTRREGSAWFTAGGRVLGVTALGPTLVQARERAYTACRRLSFPGMHFRTDIAASAGSV